MEPSMESNADCAAKHVTQDESIPSTIEQAEITQSNDNHQPIISDGTTNQCVIDADQNLDDKSLTPDNLTVTVTYTFIFVLSFLFSVFLKIHFVVFNRRSDRIKFCFSETFAFCNQLNIKTKSHVNQCKQNMNVSLFWGLSTLFSSALLFLSLFLSSSLFLCFSFSVSFSLVVRDCRKR